MIAHEVTLLDRLAVAEGTMAFRLSRPSGFDFAAGQAIKLQLIDAPPESGQGSRTLSLVSAPFESDLVVATRMRDSAYKRALKALPPGAKLRLLGPLGKFGLDKAEGPALFIAGGIGITPFMSMLRQAAKDRSARQLFLAYSNRRPQDAAFLDELQQLERRNEHFHLLATMTDDSARAWGGETGLIDANLLQGLVGDLSAPTCYLVGPPGMVEAMQSTLGGAGVAADRIHTEEFYGY